MKNKFLLAALVLPLLLTSCATLQKQKKQPEEVQLTPLQQALLEADACAARQEWEQAYIKYSAAQKDIEDVKLYRSTQLKVSNALYKMGRYPAALSALAPMPELPATLNDCQKLAMASRIFQKMKGKPEHVEALLEVALDNEISEPGVIEFKAAGFAELGKIYVEHKKLPRAVKCFQYASRLYKSCGNKEQAEACRNIAEYLK